MKFDPFKRVEVKPNAENKAPEGRLQLWASRPVALFVCAEGYEVLVGTGVHFDLETQAEMTFRAEGEDGVRVFIEKPQREVFEPTGDEVFTNIDRKPNESGTIAEVRRAVRLAQLEMREMLRQAREAGLPIKRDGEAEEAQPKGDDVQKPDGKADDASG